MPIPIFAEQAEPTLAVVITALITATLTFTLVKFLDRLRKKDAETEAQAILERANRESANRLREAELEIKERALQQKAETEEELGKIRDELRERERLLDKRTETLEQQADDLRKQERIVESTQRRLAERLEDTNRRNEELAKLLDMQRQTLHELSGLNREEAEQRLLAMLETELAQETGAIILKHEKRIAEQCDANGPRDAADGPAALRRRPHGREHDQHGRHPQRRDEGADHRPRRAQHPRLREGHRRGRDHRRHAGRGDRQRLRSGPPRSRPAVAGQTDRRRPHPPLADRGDRGGDAARRSSSSSARRAKRRLRRSTSTGCTSGSIYMLGRLHFRTSYSQNVLRHCVEVAFLAGMLAEMIGLDGDLARRCGLLHDIGKAADHELEGGHPKIGADLLKRHGESAGSRPRRAGPPRRDRHRVSLHDAGRHGRRLQRLAARVPAASRWNATSSGWKSWSRSPAASPASNRPLPFRPAASCA